MFSNSHSHSPSERSIQFSQGFTGVKQKGMSPFKRGWIHYQAHGSEELCIFLIQKHQVSSIELSFMNVSCTLTLVVKALDEE